jgi:hypothetical protein
MPENHDAPVDAHANDDKWHLQPAFFAFVQYFSEPVSKIASLFSGYRMIFLS